MWAGGDHTLIPHFSLGSSQAGGAAGSQGIFSSTFRNLCPTACSLLLICTGKSAPGSCGHWREGHDPGLLMDVLGQRNPQPQQLQGENSSASTQIPPGRAALAFPRAEPGTAAQILLQPGNHCSLSLQPLSLLLSLLPAQEARASSPGLLLWFPLVLQ